MDEKVVLMCGKGRCCPEAIFHEDGSVDIVDTDDGRNDRVHLSAGQKLALFKALEQRIK